MDQRQSLTKARIVTDLVNLVTKIGNARKPDGYDLDELDTLHGNAGGFIKTYGQAYNNDVEYLQGLSFLSQFFCARRWSHDGWSHYHLDDVIRRIKNWGGITFKPNDRMLDKKFVIKVCYGGIEEIMPDLRHTLKRVFGEAYASITFQGIGGLH